MTVTSSSQSVGFYEGCRGFRGSPGLHERRAERHLSHLSESIADVSFSSFVENLRKKRFEEFHKHIEFVDAHAMPRQEELDGEGGIECWRQRCEEEA